MSFSKLAKYFWDFCHNFITLLQGRNEESSLGSSAELSADGLASRLKICIKSTCNVYTIQHDNVFTAGTGFE